MSSGREKNSGFTGRERRRLQTARENGYLDAFLGANQRLVEAHGLWCWRLKLPMVWFQRQSRYSRYGLVYLDMLTTPHMLTAAGQAALHALGSTEVSPHEAMWGKIPRANLAPLGRAVLRAVLKAGHHRLNEGPTVTVEFPAAAQLQVVPRHAIGA